MIARRRLLRGTTAIVGLSLLEAFSFPIAWAAMAPTSAQGRGPFYPSTKPSDQDTDLTIVAGRGGAAEGELLDLSGRVLTTAGAPVANARVEIWQANSRGRYAHPGDRSGTPLDPNFQGYGVATTGADGGYRFRTIRPAAYATGGGLRPPHIHFAITGQREQLITQMYFPDQPLNTQDWLFRNASDPKTLVADLARAGAAWTARWDIVLVRS